MSLLKPAVIGTLVGAVCVYVAKKSLDLMEKGVDAGIEAVREKAAKDVTAAATATPSQSKE